MKGDTFWVSREGDFSWMSVMLIRARVILDDPETLLISIAYRGQIASRSTEARAVRTGNRELSKVHYQQRQGTPMKQTTVERLYTGRLQILTAKLGGSRAWARQVSFARYAKSA